MTAPVCERCVPACPVDCIVLKLMPLAQANDPAHADVAREHFQRREARLEQQHQQREAELVTRKHKYIPQQSKRAGCAGTSARKTTGNETVKRADVVDLFTRLRELDPHPTTELDYGTPFELLVAVVLSAQATDVGVNKATRKLYPVANTPKRS